MWEYLSMNGKRLVWVGLSAMIMFCVVSCGSTQESRAPEGLIPKEEMVNLLMDVYNTEARIASFAQNYDSSQQIFNLVEADILAQYGATPESYKETMQYYFDHPDQLLEIYEAVVDSLSFQERKLTQERKER